MIRVYYPYSLSRKPLLVLQRNCHKHKNEARACVNNSARTMYVSSYKAKIDISSFRLNGS